MRVAVYCASSTSCHAEYHEAARTLGELLANGGHEIIYGGGAVGSMGALAEGALASGGKVFGVIPRFMFDLEWGNEAIHDLEVVEDMRTRKHRMLTGSDAVVAMAGGTGTLEELLEALTLKRLGIYTKPIVLLNTNGFYEPLVTFLRQTIDQQFMRPAHAKMWTMAEEPKDVLEAIATAPPWDESAQQFAGL